MTVKTKEKGNPKAKANFLSKWFFCWMNEIFLIGYYKDLQLEDLYKALKEDESDMLGAKLEGLWHREVACAEKAAREPSLSRTLFKAFWKPILGYTALQMFQTLVLRVAPPLLLSRLILYFSGDSASTTRAEAAYYAGGLFVILLINTIVYQQKHFGTNQLGMRMRIACCSVMYRKLLRLSRCSLVDTTAGQIVNMMSNDVARLETVMIYGIYVVASPLQVPLLIYLIWQYVGVTVLIGLAVMLLQTVVVQAALGSLIAKVRMSIAIRTDERMRLTNEFITGIQVIKMYAWEKPLALLVEAARRLEIKTVTKASYLRMGFLVFVSVAERVSLFATLAAYALLGNALTAAKVFPLATFFNVLGRTLSLDITMGMNAISETSITVKRIQSFLLLEEKSVDASPLADGKPMGSVEVVAASATWSKTSTETLRGVDLRVKRGELVAIVGAVGSGKSSVLQLLAKELPLQSGSCDVTGTISYASQEPWLFVDTIRNNILMGQEYDSNRYADVVRVCALRQDLKQFSSGDMTVVGERGVTLSGGQKARINLARAVYGIADVYLLDDPLSALDSHVSSHVMDECIVNFLAGRTRVLVTHQLHLLTHVSHVVLLDKGRVRLEGSYDDVIAKHLTHEEGIEDSDDVSELTSLVRSASRRSTRRVGVAQTNDAADADADAEHQPDETRGVGNITWRVYVEYFRSGGGAWLFALLVVLTSVAQGTISASDYWLKVWMTSDSFIPVNQTTPTFIPTPDPYHFYNLTTDPGGDSHLTFVDLDYHHVTPTEYVVNVEVDNYYVTVYGILNAAALLLIAGYLLLFFTICMRASVNIHTAIFGNVIRATMRFFHTNPSGRILNRFSKDMGAVDELLPRAFSEMMMCLLPTIGALVLVVILNYWLVIPVGFFLAAALFLREVYTRSARDLKRLEGTSRSPVFSHLNETIAGITTIRANNCQVMACNKFDEYQDVHTSAFFLFNAIGISFIFHLEIMGVILTGIVSLTFLLLGTEMLGARVGLALSQCLAMNIMMTHGIHQSTEVANLMTAVERVLEYTHIELEPQIEQMPPKNWPTRGCVTFRQVSLKYSADSAPVLKNLSFEIQSSQKVGVVGRTGAGKSTLIAALFRLAWQDGEVLIDSLDTSTISLEALRSSLSIIPQDPVIFSSTIRSNLDPLNQYQDEQIWDALEEVKLKDSFHSLSFMLEEGGGNLSVGQRQLVCLARAVLKNNKILVMDEATANVDQQTDALIQETIRRRFSGCTVLTIAHRLNTIIDSDKVMVMQAGELLEFDHPHLLLKRKKDSLFWRMVQDVGPIAAQQLATAAEEAYLKVTNNVGRRISDSFSSHL